MEPPYSYEQNALTSEALQAIGMGQGFNAQTMNHPIFSQQPKHALYPDVDNQHSSFPSTSAQSFNHPFNSQHFGSVPPGMQSYGAYMSHQMYNSFFQNRPSYMPFPPPQQLLPPFSPVYNSSAQNQKMPSPSHFEHCVPNHKTRDMAATYRNSPDIKNEESSVNSSVDLRTYNNHSTLPGADGWQCEEYSKYGHAMLGDNTEGKRMHQYNSEVNCDKANIVTTEMAVKKQWSSGTGDELDGSLERKQGSESETQVANEIVIAPVVRELGITSNTSEIEEIISDTCPSAGSLQEQDAHTDIRTNPLGTTDGIKKDEKGGENMTTPSSNSSDSWHQELREEGGDPSAVDNVSAELARSTKQLPDVSDTTAKNSESSHCDGEAEQSVSSSVSQSAVPASVVPELEMNMTRQPGAHGPADETSEVQAYTCPVCGQQLRDEILFARHLQIHTGEEQYDCELCGRSFTNSTELKKHIKSHTGEKPFACTQCERMFYDNSSLQHHMGCHSGEKRHKCHICGRAFAQMGNLRVHLKGKHAEPAAFFNCTACDARFDRQKDLKEHLKTHQYGIDMDLVAASATRSGTTVEVEKSGIPNPDQESMTQLMGKLSENTGHGDSFDISAEEFHDDVCGKDPSSVSMAASKPGYIMRDGILYFVCVICLEEFNETQAYKAHMKTHKINRPLPKLQCPVPGCHAILTGNSTFRRHLKTHTGSRPHQCPECNKAFTHAADLTKHKRIHTEYKPFPCGRCGRRFHDSSSLRRHNFWHTGQIPYACPFCHKPFSHTGKLGAHMLSVHNADPDERYNCEFCPKSFCTVPTLDKHITNKHADKFPDGYTPPVCVRVILGPGGVARNNSGIKVYHDWLKSPNQATARDRRISSESTCQQPQAKKPKRDAGDDSHLSLSSHEHTDVDSTSNASLPESNSCLRLDSDSNIGSQGNVSKSSSLTLPPLESNLGSMVSMLSTQTKSHHDVRDTSDISDSSEGEEQ